MSDRDAHMRSILLFPDDDTPRLTFADRLDDEGEPDRAEFVRCQIELERFRTFEPSHRKEFNEQGRVWLEKRMTRLERGESDSIKYARAVEKGGQLYVQRREHLRIRERALFAAHGAEWFGPGAVLEMPKFYASIGYTYIVPARGFPAHWYGTWSKWVGGVCEECGGRGGLHNDMHYSDDPCPARCANGRIPGACETIAWRRGWEMECGTCGGVKLRFTGPNGLPKCPKCGNSSQNAVPHGSPELRRCASCKTVWNPDVCPTCHGSGRVPRPVPSGAVPLSTINLTTWPSVEELSMYGCVSSSREGAQTVATFKAWPGLRFHLPSERAGYAESIDGYLSQIAATHGIAPHLLR
jgi:uncharacterized protein (TIGR02996 family)